MNPNKIDRVNGQPKKARTNKLSRSKLMSMRKIKPRGLESRFYFKTKIDLVNVNIQQEEKPRENVSWKSPRASMFCCQ